MSDKSQRPNPDNLTFVGAGGQGKVYRMDATRCIKYYVHPKYLRRELSALQRARGNPLFPHLHSWGDDYLIREYIAGTPLHEYLANHALSQSLAGEILSIHETLVNLGYRRADFRLEHLILTPGGRLRMIDPANLMEEDRTYPSKLLKDLKRLGRRDEFLTWTAKLRPDTYRRWKKHL